MGQSERSLKDLLCENVSFSSKEAYKKLRTNIMLALPKIGGGNIIGITSSQPSEGKSLTAVNLAYAFSTIGRNVLLIDCDMRQPSIAKKLNMELTPGFSDLLTDIDDISAVIRNYVDSDGNRCFDVITGGEIRDDSSELLLSHRFEVLLSTLRKAYDMVIIDLPPLGAVIDAVEVGKFVDGMVVVVRENKCPLKLFSNCIKQLEFAKINIIGVVVNGSLEGVGKKYQKKYGYGYY